MIACMYVPMNELVPDIWRFINFSDNNKLCLIYKIIVIVSINHMIKIILIEITFKLDHLVIKTHHTSTNLMYLFKDIHILPVQAVIVIHSLCMLFNTVYFSYLDLHADDLDSKK